MHKYSKTIEAVIVVVDVIVEFEFTATAATVNMVVVGAGTKSHFMNTAFHRYIYIIILILFRCLICDYIHFIPLIFHALSTLN